jgi:hypothetical protein
MVITRLQGTGPITNPEQICLEIVKSYHEEDDTVKLAERLKEVKDQLRKEWDDKTTKRRILVLTGKEVW